MKLQIASVCQDTREKMALHVPPVVLERTRRQWALQSVFYAHQTLISPKQMQLPSLPVCPVQKTRRLMVILGALTFAFAKQAILWKMGPVSPVRGGHIRLRQDHMPVHFAPQALITMVMHPSAATNARAALQILKMRQRGWAFSPVYAKWGISSRMGLVGRVMRASTVHLKLRKPSVTLGQVHHKAVQMSMIAHAFLDTMLIAQGNHVTNHVYFVL